MSHPKSVPSETGMFSDVFTGNDRRMLTELGFFAMGAGLSRVSDQIFSALEVLCDGGSEGSNAARIGLAIAAMARDEPQAAVDILRRSPPSDAITAYLGIALAKTGAVNEAKEILSELVAGDPESPHADLAKDMLATLNRE